MTNEKDAAQDAANQAKGNRPEAPQPGAAGDGGNEGGAGGGAAPQPATAQAEESAADPGGDGAGRAPGADAGAGAPPAAAQPEETAAEADDDGPVEGFPPEVEALRPVFTAEDAWQSAANAALAAMPSAPAWSDERVTEIFLPAFQYGRAKGFGHTPETFYRYVAAHVPDVPAWGARDETLAFSLRVFAAVAGALCEIVDEQQRAFEDAIDAHRRGAVLQAMRRKRAGRREKKAQRMARRPEAVRKMIETQKRNRAANLPQAKKLPPPKVTLKGKGKKGKR